MSTQVDTISSTDVRVIVSSGFAGILATASKAVKGA